jgi:hypothetical protein
VLTEENMDETGGLVAQETTFSTFKLTLYVKKNFNA